MELVGSALFWSSCVYLTIVLILSSTIYWFYDNPIVTLVLLLIGGIVMVVGGPMMAISSFTNIVMDKIYPELTPIMIGYMCICATAVIAFLVNTYIVYRCYWSEKDCNYPVAVPIISNVITLILTVSSLVLCFFI